MKHPQSVKLARYRLIAEQLRSAGNLPKPFAGNRWHEGLYLSYAADNVANYLRHASPQLGNKHDGATPKQSSHGLSAVASAG